MKKTIGIITISKVNNYGADLQAFALQKKLNLMGYDAEVIDYLFYKHNHFLKEEISKPFIHFPLKKRIKEHLLPVISYIRTFPNKEVKKRRIRGFESFHKRFTRFSNTCFRSYSELYDNSPIYDVYCTGSDQVWNPNCFTSLNPYLLTFVPENKKRISYAASFGVQTIPLEGVNNYKDALLQFNHISVREKSGLKLVKDLINKKAEYVLDPTLLLTQSEWNEVASDKLVPKEKYLLLYVLTKSKYIPLLAKKIAKELNLKIVRVCSDAYKMDSEKCIHNIIDAAPDDFVGLFNNASFVLTNSFHGTIFSIIYEKQFYTILPQHKDNNSRQIDLLNMVGLNSRLIFESDSFPQIDNSINYIKVNETLEMKRIKSIAFLNGAIND